jgi:uncharacterized membrane protein YphA (DoxX/SURF4 family)
MDSVIKSHAAIRAGNVPGWGRPLLALVMIGLGIVGLYTGDFASVWQRIPIEHLPGRMYFAYAVAVIELACGLGLLFTRTAQIASKIFLVFTLLWLILLKVPAVVAAPQIEGTWLGFGEIGVIVAGAWTLFAAFNAGRPERFFSGGRGIRAARVLFAVALPMIGLSHFFYTDETVKFVPAWMPAPIFWAYLTGAGSIAACIAILTGILARLAATLEAAMLVVITMLVWMPGLNPAPIDRGLITGFLISSAIACGAWVVADSYRGTSWMSVRKQT